MISLYKEGSIHTVRGVLCEIVRCKPKNMQWHLERGCVKDPKELLKPRETDTINPIRLQAREAGIDGWETKRIKTLEGLLNESDKPLCD